MLTYADGLLAQACPALYTFVPHASLAQRESRVSKVHTSAHVSIRQHPHASLAQRESRVSKVRKTREGEGDADDFAPESRAGSIKFGGADYKDYTKYSTESRGASVCGGVRGSVGRGVRGESEGWSGREEGHAGERHLKIDADTSKMSAVQSAFLGIARGSSKAKAPCKRGKRDL
jgi:hypothetical protein